MHPADAPKHTTEEQLATLEAERDEYLNDLKRVAAEFENYRKRVLRDPEGLGARGRERRGGRSRAREQRAQVRGESVGRPRFFRRCVADNKTPPFPAGLSWEVQARRLIQDLT